MEERNVPQPGADEIPPEFICPISQTLMKEPVVSRYGHTYDKEAILNWLNTPQGIGLRRRSPNHFCPLTRKPLKLEELYPNLVLKALIEKYQLSQARVADRAQRASSSSNNTASSMGLFSSTTAQEKTHQDVINELAKKLAIDASSVALSAKVQQALVAAAGIYTNQHDSQFTRHNADFTAFDLNFANDAECHRFMDYYKRRIPNALGEQQKLRAGRYRILLRTNLLCGMVAKHLKDFMENFSHEALMRQAAELLQVPYRDIYVGDALETALVKTAGITTSQSSAMFRRNTDYSTRFKLSFRDNQERQQFINYYNTNFPGLLLPDSQNRDANLLHMDTKLLMQNVLPKLAEQQARPRPT